MSSTRPAQTTRTAAEKPPKVVHGNGFTMIRPDTSKHTKLKKVAEKEEQAYQQYKDTKRHSYHTTNGTVGSSPVSTRPRVATSISTRVAAPRPIRSTASTTSSTSSYRTGAAVIQRTAATNARAAQYSDDPLHIERHKSQQRQRSEGNKLKEQDRQARLDQNRREQNSKFLDRLERK